jgi:hypothetical protein
MKKLILFLLLSASAFAADTWILRDSVSKVTFYTSVCADGFIPEAIGYVGAEVVCIVQVAP